MVATGDDRQLSRTSPALSQLLLGPAGCPHKPEQSQEHANPEILKISVLIDIEDKGPSEHGCECFPTFSTSLHRTRNIDAFIGITILGNLV